MCAFGIIPKEIEKEQQINENEKEKSNETNANETKQTNHDAGLAPFSVDTSLLFCPLRLPIFGVCCALKTRITLFGSNHESY